MTVVLTCPEHPVKGALFSFGRGPTQLSRGAHVRRGGRGVGLRREVGRRVPAGHQDLTGAHEAHAVKAWQHHGLLDDVLAHGAVQLLLQALHVGLMEANGLTRGEWRSLGVTFYLSVHNGDCGVLLQQHPFLNFFIYNFMAFDLGCTSVCRTSRKGQGNVGHHR